MKKQLIFYVDDDSEDHELLQSAVNEVNKEVIVQPFFDCNDLLAALNDKQNPGPDLILLDINMPGNLDYECLKTLKQTAHFNSIPVAMYSTSDSERDIQETVALGTVAYFVKERSFAKMKQQAEEIIRLATVN